jgi:hypothetical protein
MKKFRVPWLLIFFFFSLSVILLEGLVSIKKPNYSYSVKNGLTNGIKECTVRKSKNLPTRFSDISSFKQTYSNFKIKSIDKNSCFKAKASPLDQKETWFEIELDQLTGGVLKTCGDSSKKRCNKGNIW